MPVETGRKKIFLLAVLLLAAIAVSYGNSLPAPFIFDDHTQILKNPYTKGIHNIPAVFTSGFSRLSVTGSNYYRPVLETSYILDRSLYGTHPAGYHVTSVGLHMMCTLALFALVQRLFRKTKISFFTALLFGVHPVYTSGVTYISGRGDSMVILFEVLSFLYYLKYLQSDRPGPGYAVLAAVFLLLAVLTKESALFFAVMPLLYRYIRPDDPDSRYPAKKWNNIYISTAAAVVIYMMMRSSAVSNMVTFQYNIAASAEWHVRLFTFLRAFFDYIVILVLPVGLHLERTIPLARDPFTLDVMAGLVLLALSIYAAFRLRAKNYPVCFGITWYLINLIPVSNLFIPLNAYIAENWIQLPAIGLFIAVSAQASRISESTSDIPILKILRAMAIPGMAVLAICYSCLTILRNVEYRDPFVFYESAIRRSPGASKLYNNLGLEIEERTGDKKRAEELYRRAVETGPTNVSAINNLANVCSADGRYEEAIMLYNMALVLDNKRTGLLNNLGVAYIRKGDRKNALASWQRSLEINPNQPDIEEYIKRSRR